MRTKAKPTTLKAGESVIVNLRDRGADAGGAWSGRVLDLDATAIRLAVSGHRIGVHGCNLGWWPSSGERVIPWSRIDDVRLNDVAP